VNLIVKLGGMAQRLRRKEATTDGKYVAEYQIAPRSNTLKTTAATPCNPRAHLTQKKEEILMKGVPLPPPGKRQLAQGRIERRAREVKEEGSTKTVEGSASKNSNWAAQNHEHPTRLGQDMVRKASDWIDESKTHVS